MQVGEDQKYLKMAAGLKHYIAYSVETDRKSFIPNITTFDLWDTYLPQFQRGFAPDGGTYALVFTYPPFFVTCVLSVPYRCPAQVMLRP